MFPRTQSECSYGQRPEGHRANGQRPEGHHADGPKVTVPTVNVPKVTVPTVTVPRVNVPRVTVPTVNPKVTMPTANVPKVNGCVPRVTVPTVNPKVTLRTGSIAAKVPLTGLQHGFTGKNLAPNLLPAGAPFTPGAPPTAAQVKGTPPAAGALGTQISKPPLDQSPPPTTPLKVNTKPGGEGGPDPLPSGTSLSGRATAPAAIAPAATAPEPRYEYQIGGGRGRTRRQVEPRRVAAVLQG